MSEDAGGLRSTYRAIAVVLGHTFLACISVGMILMVEALIRFLWADSDPMFFGRIPLKWFFDVSILSVGIYYILSIFLGVFRVVFNRGAR
jgi:hypothetical protein